MDKVKATSHLRQGHTHLPVLKSTTRALQPIAMNRAHEAPIHKPAAKLLPSRRSKSFSDLSTVVRRPLFNVPARINTRPTAATTAELPSSGAPQRPAFASKARAPVKRPAPKADAEAKPKVSKPSKPAPYDYKARFNLLTERHTTLVQNYKDAKQKIADHEKELATFDVLKKEHTAVQALYKEAQAKIVTLDSKNLELKDDVRNLKAQLAELIVMHESLKKEHASLQALNTKNEDAVRQVTQTVQRLEDELKTLKAVHLQRGVDLQECKVALLSHEDMRRALHNQIQDLKGTIRVFCRVRPQLENEDHKLLCNISFIDESTLEVRKSKESINCISGKLADLKQEFSFDKVFPPEASQAEIFEELSQLVQSALDGYHVCVFAYGQTGSGKTYTMQGEGTEESSGMIPRTVELIFNLVTNLTKLGWNYTVEASFLEIYNEAIRDLLDPHNKEQHDVRYNDGKGMTVTNLITKTVDSVACLRQLMAMANRNRATAATNFNEHSSRSHAVTKIMLTGIHSERRMSYIGSLNLVDLAGSESAKTTTNDRITETKHINKSLSTLGTVMTSLHNKDSHIPFRNSKLTYLLQSCLGGNSKTLMIVNIAPFEECYNESINALRFASKVKEVRLGSKRNKTYLTRELSNVTK